ncbi:MAG: NADH:flavin oxidoreductase [Spirochaetales bacterium]|nr:NADH:flavin oxidoreductase [Candidatus Physcosoma equi]
MMLRDEILVGEYLLQNRLVMPPMASGTSTEEGFVTDDLIAYYTERIENGSVGLVVTEHAYVTERGKASPRQLSIASDEAIPGLKRLVEAIHGCGSAVLCQINHAGSAARAEVTGLAPEAPSAVPHPSRKDPETPEEMTKEEILKAEEAFLAAALRAQKAGYDGVEIHSAHGYLLNQFYSPLSNKRTDEYGGTLENRLRMLMEIVKKVREAVGEEFLIAVRFGGSDYREGGSTLDDAARGAALLEACSVDLLDVSGGMCFYVNPNDKAPGYFRNLSLAIKEKVTLPVVLTGGIERREDADALLEEECADMIGVGRAILKDPKWAQKAMEA